MPTVTEYFDIKGTVPFVDVEVERDNLLFLDPHAVRLHARIDGLAAFAVSCLDSFLDEVTTAVASNDRVQGATLLTSFHEPWETRLGMAERGFFGHGGADDIGAGIWDALSTDLRALVDVGVLRRLEHLPMFVEGVDRDITSDITTRVVFKSLLQFTGQIMVEHPSLAREGVCSLDARVWDPSVSDWTTARCAVPLAQGKPLVLVPSGWARPRLLMSASRFYDTALLSYAQLERAVLLSSGDVLLTPKRVLRKQQGLKTGRATNAAVTLRAHDRGEDLVRLFGAFVDERYWREQDAA